MTRFNKIILIILIIKLIAIITTMLFVNFDKKEENTLIEYKHEER